MRFRALPVPTSCNRSADLRNRLQRHHFSLLAGFHIDASHSVIQKETEAYQGRTATPGRPDAGLFSLVVQQFVLHRLALSQW
jgi:hypothetical protein